MTQKMRLSDEVRKKIRQIEIYTRRLLSGALVGDTRSAIKGTGYEFDQIREYQIGDDIRFIDWNSSARMNKVLIKQYVEERSRTILLAVDISASGALSSAKQTKHDVLAQLTSALSLVGNVANDRVGLLLFSDEVEHYIPPGRGRFHVQTIMNHVFGYKPKKTRTNIACVLQHLAKLKEKDAVLFLLSDFIDDSDYKTYLSLVARKYDCVAVRCLDTVEQELPSVGFITIEDIETGETLLLDSRKKSKKYLSNFFQKRIEKQNRLFKKYGVDLLEVVPHKSFIADVITFFRRRMRY